MSKKVIYDHWSGEYFCQSCAEKERKKKSSNCKLGYVMAEVNECDQCGQEIK